MGAQRQTHNALAETPFWRTSFFRCGCIAAGVLAFSGLTVYLVRLNHRQQIEWSLDEDPRLSGFKNKVTKAIAEAKLGDEAAPRALWLGQVKRVVVPVGGSGDKLSMLIELQSPSLLAGAKGRKDAEPLSISGQGYSFGVRKPQAGETWMFAVRRDKDERALIISAMLTDLK